MHGHRHRRAIFAVRGFTLLEVIAVILILGTLSGIAVVKYIDYSGRARQSAEAATIAAIKGGLNLYRMNAAAAGTTPLWPSALDAATVATPSSAAAPYFNVVLQPPVTGGWSKTATANTYVAPSGNQYIYDPATGLFGTAADVAASAAGSGASGSGTAGAGGGSPAGGSKASNLYVPKQMYTSAATWKAGTNALDGFIGSGYAMNENGEIMMTDSTKSFTEASRRVTLAGEAMAGAGTYTVALDTELTNYYNQLNYWKVIGVKNGTTLNLSGNSLNWGYDQPGTKTLMADYAPPAKSDGSWYSYSGSFTVSAADAASYDQIVVVMAGSRFSGQVLGWRNVSIKGP